jgi:hypothetical protein
MSESDPPCSMVTRTALVQRSTRASMATVMSCSRLTLLLFLYVTADFANPLMPGAVSYPNGSVEAVHVERSRTADVLPPGAPVVAFFERIELTGLLQHPPRVTPIRPVTGLRLIPARRALRTRPDSPPSSEDH